VSVAPLRLTVGLYLQANTQSRSTLTNSEMETPMEQTGLLAGTAPSEVGQLTVTPSTVGDMTMTAAESVSAASCPRCGGLSVIDQATGGFIYAIGKIEPRFPSPGTEKEFAQVTGMTGTAGLTDSEALHAILSKRENRYLARQLCWVLTIEGLETYLLQPRDPVDFDLLVEAVRSAPSPMDMDVVVGLRGPIAPPSLCNGLMLPIVAFDKIYSFDRETLIKSIPRPEKAGAKEYASAARELLDRILQIADNAGAMDEHRALNYLAVRYPAIYAKTAEQYAANASLTAVDVRPSPLSSTRKIVDVIFCFTNRQTDVTEKFFVRVDVTEEFPFLVTKLSPYFDH
jgi:hypothetical protein